MHDREFEKKVQQQMQELRLAPGSEVWARVQEDLRKKKRRRPVIIWLFLAGLLLGGSAWLLYGIQDDKSGQPTATVKPTSGKPDPEKTAVTMPAAVSKPTGTAPVSTASSETNSKPETFAIQQSTNPVTKKKIQPARQGREHQTDVRDVNLPDNNNIDVVEVNTNEVSLRYANTPDELLASAAVNISVAAPVAAISNTNKPVNKKPTSQPSKWQWGVQAGAGISDLGMELFQGATVADYAYNSGGSVTGGQGPNTIPRASEVRSGAAFQLGGYVSKSIGRRLRAKVGLGYEYYSNRITVGDYVPSARFVNQGAGNMSMVDEYYKALGNNEYTNRYHFASLPVSLQWQLGNHARRNLVWENGITLSRMLHTNALIYDGAGGAYYKDNNVFKKTQWTFSTSLLFSIKSKNNLQFYAGPHVQYGLSDLMKNNDKHMRYAGLKLAVGFNKK